MKKEKIETVIEVNGRQYGKEQLVEILDAFSKVANDNADKSREIARLKSAIGGYKTSNAKYRENLAKAEAYGKEADELIDKKVSVIDELNRTIDALNGELAEQKSKYRSLESRFGASQGQASVLTLGLAMAKRPWWKKIF